MSSLTWHVSYQKDRGYYLHLNTTPTWVEAVSPITERVAHFFLCRLPFAWAFRLGNCMMAWPYNQEKSRLVIPVTKEQVFALQPGEWESFHEDDADV
jgi:hypothetical protein